MTERTSVQTSIERIRAYMDRDCAKPTTVAQLARRAGLSTFHFIRVFRDATGTTPHQYLRARRIDRARHLLATTAMPVTEICDAVGFRSLGSFSRIFRAAAGEAPAAYRRRHYHPQYVPACFVRMYRAGR
jgi:transcriptional regulator GlxA family with amidase domain